MNSFASSTLTGKIAFVSGASKGIGASIATHLAAAGAAVVVNYATSQSGADKVVAEIIDAGGKAIAVQGDFSQPEDITRVFAAVKQQHGHLDILVNCAGVYSFGPIEEVTPAEFHRQFNLNVLGLLLSTQAALPLFGPDGGSIINIGSIVGSMSPAYGAVYAATKGAVDSLTVSLSKELGVRHIRVNSLNPGMVETEGLKTAGMTEGAFLDAMLKVTPLGRTGQPEDIARIAVFLASDDAYWIDGQRLIAAGGATL